MREAWLAAEEDSGGWPDYGGAEPWPGPPPVSSVRPGHGCRLPAARPRPGPDTAASYGRDSESVGCVAAGGEPAIVWPTRAPGADIVTTLRDMNRCGPGATANVGPGHLCSSVCHFWWL